MSKNGLEIRNRNISQILNIAFETHQRSPSPSPSSSSLYVSQPFRSQCPCYTLSPIPIPPQFLILTIQPLNCTYLSLILWGCPLNPRGNTSLPYTMPYLLINSSVRFSIKKGSKRMTHPKGSCAGQMRVAPQKIPQEEKTHFKEYTQRISTVPKSMSLQQVG